MTTSLYALLAFTAWTLLLVFVVLLYRTGIVFMRRHPANSWPRGEKPPTDEPGVVTRMGHAYLNCLEGLPVFAALIAIAAISGQLQYTDPLAPWVVVARVGQSVTHMIGVSHWLVFIRANFFAAQLLLYGAMILGLLP